MVFSAEKLLITYHLYVCIFNNAGLIVPEVDEFLNILQQMSCYTYITMMTENPSERNVSNKPNLIDFFFKENFLFVIKNSVLVFIIARMDI